MTRQPWNIHNPIIIDERMAEETIRAAKDHEAWVAGQTPLKCGHKAENLRSYSGAHSRYYYCADIMECDECGAIFAPSRIRGFWVYVGGGDRE